MDGKQLRAIEERANRATPGPWEEVAESGEWWVTAPETGVHFVMATNARTDVPALIAEIRELRAKLDAVPGYVFACINARERGEMVLPSLGEWLADGDDTDTDAAAGIVIPDDGGDE